MPTISIFHQDFEQLLGQSASVDQIESWLCLVKGELKDHTPATGELRIELQDSNRPDTWCVEGIARQIRTSLAGKPISYPLFSAKGRIKRRLLVLPGIEKLRPFVAACAVRVFALVAIFIPMYPAKIEATEPNTKANAVQGPSLTAVVLG